MKTFIRVMKSLSDSNRIKIIKILQRKTLCVCEIQAVLKVSQSTVSAHLKILEEAGLIESRKDGLWVNYSLSNGSASPFASGLLDVLKHWLEDDPEITATVSKVDGISRESLCKR